MGRHELEPSLPYLIYMPHCSRALYESVLQTNFAPSLGKTPRRLVLGNDLAEYIGYVRPGTQDGALPVPNEDEFTKAKKKRKGKNDSSPPKDGVLERLGMMQMSQDADGQYLIYPFSP
jgi:DnaJ family protein A protein 5